MPTNPFVRSDEMLDFTAPDIVEVTVTPEGDRLWVNVNGRCVLRCCQVKEMKVQDGPMTSYYNQAGKIAEFKYED